jgi:hypothetical protein
MTKKKKDNKGEKAKAVVKIARKTLGLVVMVGDALEAAVAASTAAPQPPSPTPPLAPTPSLATSPAPPLAPPLAPTPSSAPAASPVGVASAPAPLPSPVEDGARALAALEAYAIAHNLGAPEMPNRDTLVDALVGGMARHGSMFTDDDVRSLIDEQMRIHFRTLGARKSAPPDPQAGS